MHLVPKKDTFRFCVDYRKLNSQTVNPSIALPRISDVSNRLHGATTFSSLNLRNADPVHDPEWIPSRMGIIPNGHHPEWTSSRMDIISSGHDPE